jgi:hypothetical protein
LLADYALEPFQEVAVDHGANFLSTSDVGALQLYSAPTGVGKSIIELMIQQRLQDPWIITPRDEIIDGMLEKLTGLDSDARRAIEPLDYQLATPIKLRNRLLDGRISRIPRAIFDECHHHNASSWQQVGLLTGLCPSIGYTATPYRGSPKSTREFRDRWGEPLPLITYQEAEDSGYISMPEFSTLPLVDDDVIDIQGGEFTITSIESETVDRMGDLAEHCRPWYTDRWDVPTIFAMPGSVTCLKFQEELARRGMPSVVVAAATKLRRDVFDAVEAGVLALIHINIVTEGVDLLLRRLVDCAPTMSPVKWVQQLGRITRKVRCPRHARSRNFREIRECDACRAMPRPKYICTNRNLLRHAYALEGCVPVSAVVESEKRWPPSQRNHTRAIGLEAIGRFKPTTTKLLDGATLYVYSVSAAVGPIVTDYVCLVHPTKEPIWVAKVNVKKEDGARDWGNWAVCEAPLDIAGFASTSSKELSEKQMKWWKRSARSMGLDPDQEVTRKSFQPLPVMADTGVRF